MSTNTFVSVMKCTENYLDAQYHNKENTGWLVPVVWECVLQPDTKLCHLTWELFTLCLDWIHQGEDPSKKWESYGAVG